jgi:23S rRNA (adenine2503-C2)-methyltransferase
MTNLYALTFDQLTDLLKSWGQPTFRTKQVWGWLYERRAQSFDEMSNLPKALRERLAAETTLGSLRQITEQRSKDGTVKRVYALPDGRMIEAVLMIYEDGRRTACISTQAGCAMGCVFCATGQMGFMRHLSVTEIFEQAMIFARELAAEDERLSNVVLMGMGEPFHNYDASVGVLRRMMDDLGIGARHLTVSTVGLVPQIRQFADEGLQVKLAISLHAAEDEARSDLLPVNKRWDIEELMDACRYYIAKTGRRVTFEWALIHGETDTPEQAERLGQLLRGMLCHVNVIPLNPTAGYGGTPSEVAATDAFVETLERYGVSATVRVRRGIDIDAGCGQLTTQFLNADDIPITQPS